MWDLITLKHLSIFFQYISKKAKLGRCVLGVFFCFQKERKQEEVLQNQFVKSGAQEKSIYR